MLIAITKEMKECWDKHPAKQYVGVPFHGVVEESMQRDDLIRLRIWREAVEKWSETEEARAAAYRIQMAEEELTREHQKFRELQEAATKTERDLFMKGRKDR